MTNKKPIEQEFMNICAKYDEPGIFIHSEGDNYLSVITSGLSEEEAYTTIRRIGDMYDAGQCKNITKYYKKKEVLKMKEDHIIITK